MAISLNGVDGEDLKSFNYSTPVDAINAIPDIVGDATMEMVIGGRDGKVYCYSGGTGLNVGIIENNGFEIYDISNAYPNPFSDQITISFEVEQESFISLRVYDLSGKVVSNLVNHNLTSGKHSVIWNGRN